MGKRFMTTILSLILTLGIIVPAIAEEKNVIDFSQYSDEELLDLEALMKVELEGRGLTNRKVNQLPTGTYKVGVDIPEGTYIFRRIPGDSYTAIIYLYDSESAKDYSSSGSAKESGGCVLGLKEGQIMKITWTGVLASKFTADTLEW